MSTTPIFDQLLAEQPGGFSDCSKVFPKPMSWEAKILMQEKINMIKAQHPAGKKLTPAQLRAQRKKDSLTIK